MHYFRIFLAFLFIQVSFHFVANILSPIDQSEVFCYLDLCITKKDNPTLATLFQFGWFFYLLIFFFIFTYNRLIGLTGAGAFGAILIVIFSDIQGYQLDLFIICSGTSVIVPFFRAVIPNRKTKEGFDLWITLGLCSIILLFPLSWVLRFFLQPNEHIPPAWEITLIVMSIVSVISISAMLAAIFAKPESKSNKDNIVKASRREKKKDRPVIESVVSLFYFGSLFFGTDHVENMSPLSIFYPVFIFWLVIYPLLKTKKTLFKTIIFTIYVITFLLSFDSLIYQVIQMMRSTDEFQIIVADYIVILIYMAMYPLFKTIPEYYFISKSNNKKFNKVLKEGFTNELLILLFILVKMNLAHYQI